MWLDVWDFTGQELQQTKFYRRKNQKLKGITRVERKNKGSLGIVF